jgi:putative serine protease PepD
MRYGLGLIAVTAIVSALLAGTLGGTLGYVFAVLNGVGGSVLVGQVDSKPASATNRAPESLAGVAKKVLPSLVTVRAQDSREQRTGSGFVVTSDGYIVTNEHVISVEADGTFAVAFDDSSQAQATLIGRDSESDIAVLKVDRSGLPPITFGDSEKLAVGDPVLALGTPLQQDKTVTFGIISALDRARPVGETPNGSDGFFAAIQTDAAINHGNSGGPLVDAGGRVIGVNEQIITADRDNTPGGSGNVGIGFAVPINQARRVATELIATGSAHRTVIGATLDTQYEGPGAKMVSVVGDGPAGKEGLKSGDIMTTFNGRSLVDGPDLIAQIRKFAPGTVVTVEYRRDGAKRTAQITLAADSNK